MFELINTFCPPKVSVSLNIFMAKVKLTEENSMKIWFEIVKTTHLSKLESTALKMTIMANPNPKL
jgi:hypothetical protein